MWSTFRQLTLQFLSRTFQKVSTPNPRVLQISNHLIEGQGQRQLLSSSARVGGLVWTGQCSLLQPWTRTSLSQGSSDSSEVGGYTIPSRGMKIKGRVKRRCKDCQLIWIEGILHNLCKTHPRHKQMLKPKYFSNMRILTHATSGFKRPW